MPRRPRWSRLLPRDPLVLLALSISIAALVISIPEGWPRPVWVLAAGAALVALVDAAGRMVRGSLGVHVRLLLCIGFVTLAAGTSRGAWPVAETDLYLPVLAMSAAMGLRPLAVVGIVATLAYAEPVLTSRVAGAPLFEHWLARGSVAALIAIGTRVTVGALEDAVARARSSMARDRRRDRQVATIERLGRRLAVEGPTPAAFQEIVDALATGFEYGLSAIHLGDEAHLVLAAQHGYADPPKILSPGVGVTGRVLRTRQPAYVRDVAQDPDYVAGSEPVTSEICVPLIARGELLGVLNVEGTGSARLDRSDLATVTLVADRLATAIALGARHAELVRRAELFERLAVFEREISATLEPDEVRQRVVTAAADVVAADATLLVLPDETGAYRIAAVRGVDRATVGREVRPGDGLAGQAIASRQVVVRDRFERSEFSSAVAQARFTDVVAACVVPLVQGDDVFGSLGFVRQGTDRPFSVLDVELLPIMAGLVTLALANARLHSQVADASIRDSLTGLYNRRHLDASIERLAAARDRIHPTERRQLAVVLFDLDHFGQVNKLYGHRVGDEVLRAFGGIIARRFRASDVVGRYGGEEFLAVLEGASRADAKRIADEVRAEFGRSSIALPDGGELRVTVSAGCAALGPGMESVGDLIAVADVGLQVAKRAGRDQVVAA